MLLRSKHIVADIKERQAERLKALAAKDKQLKLAIVVTIDDPTINVYMRMKQKYGADLGIDTEIHRVGQGEVAGLLAQLNQDAGVDGIIIQLPLERPEQTEQLVALVAPQKDVDGLGSQEYFEPATPMAILWLLSGNHVDLHDKKVLLVGRGKLVGAPLERMLQADGIDVSVATKETEDLKAATLAAGVVITATGVAGVIKPDMIKPGTVLVDAGVASEGGKTVGDVAPEMYEREDIDLTPTRGGVGPLTVCALFENVIRSAEGGTR